MPGPLNLDEEEEDNVDQDDLNVVGDENNVNQDPDSVRYKRYFFQMDFEVEFPYEDDTVYLAYSRPYHYSQIIAHMFNVEEILSAKPALKNSKNKANVEDQKKFGLKLTRKAFVYERTLLCKTISGLPVPKISLTANRPDKVPLIMLSKRKAIFVTARVHPGETNASTVFEGFVD